MTPPRPIVTPIQRPNAALLGSREERDAFADRQLEMERRQAEYDEAMAGLPENKLTPEDVNRLAGEFDERKSEGRISRPFRVNYKE